MADTYEYIECRICGEHHRALTYKHLQSHGIDFGTYTTRFPDAPTHCDAYRDIRRQIMLQKWNDPKFAQQLLSDMYNTEIVRDMSPEARKQRSETRKAWWNNLTQKERDAHISHALSQHNEKGLTFPEELLDSLLQREHPNEWQFVGNGTFTLGNHKPDFIHYTLRGVIEVFGLYWHDPELFPNRPTESELIEHYRKHNYKCLILWEHEVYDEETSVTKIKETFYAGQHDKRQDNS